MENGIYLIKFRREVIQGLCPTGIKLEEQTKRDLEDLKKNFEAACANERQLAISEMRAIAVKTALQLVRTGLSKNLSDSAKAQLLTQFIEQLDQKKTNEDFAPRQFEKIH